MGNTVLTRSQIDTIEHAKISPNNAVCYGKDSKEMLWLVELGYFSGPISAGFLNPKDAYFQITSKGMRHGR